MNNESAVAVVSGAGTGIGRAFALALAEQGYSLALVGRRLEPLGETLSLAGGGGRCFACDVRDADAVEKVGTEIGDRLGAVEVLVPCAGGALIAPLEETDPTEFSRLIETNLTGVFHLLHAFLPELRRRERGWIFPVLSIAALTGFRGWSAYCASKWGLRGMIASLREELRGTGIRVTAVYPGATATGLWDGLPGEWNRSAMVPATEVAEVVRWALALRAGTALEEVHLGPAGGAL